MSDIVKSQNRHKIKQYPLYVIENLDRHSASKATGKSVELRYKNFILQSLDFKAPWGLTINHLTAFLVIEWVLMYSHGGRVLS